jgi:hypothetical protein
LEQSNDAIARCENTPPDFKPLNADDLLVAVLEPVAGGNCGLERAFKLAAAAIFWRRFRR